ncbi:hypothetical protein PGH47_36730 [Streptomyces sp. HUAS 31]|uniref:hypothetical protein n=1 Tax=Streptomyces sp. HUAS 31 TaxID=3020055 RepID=UPI0023058406|nr:hypothetical protein [Streptomyces sp. HUAS 31]WCE00916.1 hypothetical protein PGH47_36730 [Streptomyces sp. HUAS 31]
MGVNISFIGATTEELDRAEKDPSWAEQRVSDLYGVDHPLPDRPDCGPDEELVAFSSIAAERGYGAFMNVSF